MKNYYTFKWIRMKILMVTADHNDKVLAVLAFKNLNVANSIDFVSTIDQVMDYITFRSDSDLPNLVLIDLHSNGREAIGLISAKSQLAGFNVITYSTQVYTKTRQLMDDVEEQDNNGSRVEELDWILSEICTGLKTQDGWQYRFKPSLSLVIN